MKLKPGEKFDPELNNRGLLKHIQLDMGQVISASLRPVYPNKTWEQTSASIPPGVSEKEIIIEYTAHPDASFHLSNGKVIPLKDAEENKAAMLKTVEPATKRVTLNIIDKMEAAKEKKANKGTEEETEAEEED